MPLILTTAHEHSAVAYTLHSQSASTITNPSHCRLRARYVSQSLYIPNHKIFLTCGTTALPHHDPTLVSHTNKNGCSLGASHAKFGCVGNTFQFINLAQNNLTLLRDSVIHQEPTQAKTCLHTKISVFLAKDGIELVPLPCMVFPDRSSTQIPWHTAGPRDWTNTHFVQ